MAPMIEVDHLTKTYGSTRGISDIAFQVEEGEVFGFLGPNGAGKTTTIRVLLALLRASSGQARIAGMDVWQQSLAIKRMIGYLPGELALDPALTGGQILSYLGQLRGGVDSAYLTDLIARLDFDPNRRFRHYSTGNKRKLGLIQAMMHRPRLLVLDEPTSGLDPLHQQVFEQLVRESHAAGTTIFLSSHILSEVEQTCSRVGIIREGALVRIGSVAELKAIKHREVTIQFAEPVPAAIFASLPTVESVAAQADGHGLRLVVHGTLDAIVKTAAQYPIVTISSHEPSLEEAFLHYYAGDEAHAPEASHVV
ncbi:MAG TPA: ABC transporter ATP-binding protein [Herpetosiphonaceae bacterium]|nr:ABC transporter ATP-binding protein [Herpetosiphonaceae bacterium]